MVVLEGGTMLSSAGNQYLQPDYLSPLPTTLDAKKSPLALLAQTCSQIGGDSPSTKSLLSSIDKSKKSSENARTSPNAPKEKPEKSPRNATPSDQKLAFKPYETNVLSKKEEVRPPSSSSVDDKKSDRKTASPSTPNPETGKTSPEKCTTPSARGASPIIRSGLEILHGHSKDLGSYKPYSALCCPPGLEQSNPAFRPPFPGAPFSAQMFYPGSTPTPTPGPYLSYARVKTPSGGEALVPVCKDPYCTGCQFSLQNQLMNGPCPSGCTQCDHQKYNLAMAMSLVPPGAPSLYSNLGSLGSLGRPYICNWIAGDSYCGKRFGTSDELLQHLRTHTNGTDPINHHSFASLHRPGYPNPPLSPLSARYHPYGKPLSASLAASPYSAFNPTGINPYYSAYSLYGQRLGAAAVHQ